MPGTMGTEALVLSVRRVTPMLQRPTRVQQVQVAISRRVPATLAIMEMVGLVQPVLLAHTGIQQERLHRVIVVHAQPTAA